MIKNDITKLNEFQKRLGGPGKAAKALGITYTTWFRWKKNLRAISPQTIILIDLLMRDDITSLPGQ